MQERLDGLVMSVSQSVAARSVKDERGKDYNGLVQHQPGRR
jgi:hypothetical protein